MIGWRPPQAALLQRAGFHMQESAMGQRTAGRARKMPSARWKFGVSIRILLDKEPLSSHIHHRCLF